MAHRVFVGLSGGVDSAVAAALLKEEGFDVVGVFIRIWQPEFLECTWREDRLDAMRVAVHLEIPFREVDLSQEYKKHVVESMIADYARGITPNPDVLCNQHIKFGAFAEWARREGADMIATGHYARKGEEGGHFNLLRATDTEKDQSYFLYRLGQRNLARTLFPVGGLLKSQVRAEAQRFNLPVAKKPDSQGLCFVGEVSMRDFLGRFIPLSSGPVLDQGSRTIGEHGGVALYTIGQRHGFKVKREGGPLYVIDIDAAGNTIRVSPRRVSAARLSVSLSNVHWIHHAPPFPLSLSVQTRYREMPVAATLSRRGNNLVATFAEPHIAARGQSMVFYVPRRESDGDTCLGGGVIEA